MTIEYFIAWFGVVFPLVFSPGPANIVFALSGAKQGVRKSLPLLFGVDLVYIICSLIIGFGLGEFLKSYPTFMIVIKLLGIMYIFYLVYKFLKPARKTNNDEILTIYTFYDGMILQALNPKGWTMLFVMFSLFLDGSFDHTTQVIYLVIMVAIVNIFTHLVWIFAGSLITQYIANPVTETYINYGFALSLLMVAIWLLIDTLMTL
jgi:threonine/homoserine/homoserine lactone efflux protein